MLILTRVQLDFTLEFSFLVYFAYTSAFNLVFAFACDCS